MLDFGLAKALDPNARVSADELDGAGPNVPRAFDLLPDGKRFIAVAAAGDSVLSASAPQVNIVLNWFEELKQRIPAE